MTNQSPDLIVVVLFACQALWALFMVVFTWAIRRILRDIEENTKATGKVAESVAAINVLLAGNFMTRTDYERIANWTREVDRNITELRTKDEYREQLRKEAADRGRQ